MTSCITVSFILIIRELKPWRGCKLFWRKVRWPDLVTWPDVVPKISQNVGNECKLKVRKFQLAFSSRLAMTHEKPEGGGGFCPPTPANDRVKMEPTSSRSWSRGRVGVGLEVDIFRSESESLKIRRLRSPGSHLQTVSRDSPPPSPNPPPPSPPTHPPTHRHLCSYAYTYMLAL